MGRKAVSHLLYLLAVVLTGLLLAAALVSRRASLVSPDEGLFWSTLAMLLPVILFVNFLALVWWIVRLKWVVALMPLAALVFNLGFMSSMIQFPDHRGSGDKHDIRVATLNTNGLRRMGDVAVSAATIARMTDREQVDVLCMQEFVEDRTFNADSIGRLFADRMPYFVREEGQALASRFPILDHGYRRFEDTNNDYLWADLQLDGNTVRVFSVHLQTSGISGLRHRFRKDYNQEMPVDMMFGVLEQNSRVRAQQVREIRHAIDTTRFPVILAGDFNDMPSSYTYHRMKGNLTDGFREAGSGYGGTFRYLGGLLRIDYIFYGDSFSGIRYYMPTEDVSDHKAVIADLKFER